MNYIVESLEESRKLFIDLSDEFLEAANGTEVNLEVYNQVESIRRRAALKLVPVPKMGFEHLYPVPS